MARHRTPAFPRLRAAAVLCAALAVTTSSASALDLTDLSEDVEDATDPVTDSLEETDVLPTTDPTELPDTIVGTVNDTIHELTETEPSPASSGDPPGGNDGGSSTEEHPSGTNGATSGGSGQTQGSTDREALGPSTSSSADPSADASDRIPSNSYMSLATRGVLAALDRALGLAGPLAPPLVLAGIALMTVAGASRGRSRLVKPDAGGRFPEHTFKL